MKKLSIIVPVYNVEPYIRRCLFSCLDQNVSKGDYEIIVVNDGTKDNSMTIVNEVAKEHDNIYLINQENQGLSMARNNGFAVARGEYIWFVDSDDWIEKDCLQSIFLKLKGNLDILQIQYRNIYDDESENYDAIFRSIDGYKTGKEVICSGGLPAPAQFSIYRKQFLSEKKLSFVPGIYHEDSEFKPRAVYLAEKIASLDQVCYNYYRRSSGSITSSFKMKNAIDLIKVMNSLYEFSRSFDREVLVAFNNFISMDMNALLFGYRCLSEEKQKYKKYIK